MNIGFGSHLVMLTKILNMTEGPILELGGGSYSTPYLHWACYDSKRKLVTYDNEREYFDTIKAYESDYHEVNFVEDWDKVDFSGHWSVALIDHHPNIRRKEDIKRLAQNCDYIIVHDTEGKWKHKFGYSEIYPLFKYRYDYKKTLPYTTVLSNFKDLSDLSMSKISEYLHLKGLPAHIPDCSRNELPTFLKERGYKVGAEIGVYKGEYTKYFCEAGLEIYAIDPWRAFKGQGRTQNLQERQDFLFGHAQRYLQDYKNVHFIRKTSMEALEDFKDESLDFVYIDGDHDFRHVAEDVFEWNKKVRKGGILSGHDYFCTSPQANNVICHVQHVIDAYVKTYNIENFYTFGGTNLERRGDSTKSWFWIKK